jgi:hypothetical protein
MGIGVGIVLVLAGLILLLGVVQLDIPFIDDYTLGVLLTIVGVVSIALVMFMASKGRRSTTQVIETKRETL